MERNKDTVVYVLEATRAVGHSTTETLTMYIEARPGTDVVRSCKAAARDYILTDEGLAAYVGGGNSLTWDLFDRLIPDEFLERHGIRKLGYDYSDFQLDMNEELVDPPVVYIENIKWAVDKKKLPELPISCSILVSSLELEPSGKHACEDYKKKAVEWLGKRYGSEIKGCEAKII